MNGSDVEIAEGFGEAASNEAAALDAPKIMATLTLELHEDGNMSTAFGSELPPDLHAAIGEHMVKKAAQAFDDEKFSRFLTTTMEMKKLVHAAPAGALGGQAARNGMLRRMGAR